MSTSSAVSGASLGYAFSLEGFFFLRHMGMSCGGEDGRPFIEGTADEEGNLLPCGGKPFFEDRVRGQKIRS